MAAAPRSRQRTPGEPALAECVGRHRRPEPRARLGAAARPTRAASACMDLSDGLADAVQQLAGGERHRCAASTARAADPPGGRELVHGARAGSGSGQPARGGDDYELLFAVPRKAPRPAPLVGQQARGVPLTRIGELTAEAAVVVVRDGRPEPAARRFCPLLDSVDGRSLAYPALARPSFSTRTTRHAARRRRMPGGLLRVFAAAGSAYRARAGVGVSPGSTAWPSCSACTRICPGSSRAYYTLATIGGSGAPRRRIPPGVLEEADRAVSAVSWGEFRDLFRTLSPLLRAFTLGSTLGAAVACRDRVSRLVDHDRRSSPAHLRTALQNPLISNTSRYTAPAVYAPAALT